MQRYIAFILVSFPIMLSVFGIKLIRDFFFMTLNQFFPNLITQFSIGLISLIVGMILISKFIFFRDKKRNKVQSRFK